MPKDAAGAAAGFEIATVTTNPVAATGNGSPAKSEPHSAVTWTRHCDQDDEWFTSSDGQSEWVLPPGAVLDTS